LVGGLCGHCRGKIARAEARQETVDLMEDFNMERTGVEVIDELYQERVSKVSKEI